MIILYRTVSTAEKNDYDRDGQFRTARNTIEGKQFFKSEEAVREFIKKSRLKQYFPKYDYLLIVTVGIACLAQIPYFEEELDVFLAVTIHEDDLPHFNKCIKFAEEQTL